MKKIKRTDKSTEQTNYTQDYEMDNKHTHKDLLQKH